MKYAWDYVREDIARQRKKDEMRGEKRGEKRGIVNFIKRMLENGESIEKIQLYSGSTIKEIEKIKKELKLA